jgi:hypothetical protein
MEPQELLAIGIIAKELETSAGQVRAAATLLGFAPAVVINRVAYFDAGQADQLRAHFANQSLPAPRGESHRRF